MAVLQSLVFMATGIFSGAAVYITLVEHPARMCLGGDAARREFAPAYRRGAMMQAGLAAFVVVGSCALWLNDQSLRLVHSRSWLTNGLAFAGIILWTLTVMMPINNTLIGDDAMSAEETERLLRRWALWHSVRTFVSLTMFLALCLAL